MPWRRMGYVVMITADHGNLEVAYGKEGKPHVAHTANPVPFFLIDPQKAAPLPSAPGTGSLQDVAPTVLQVLSLRQPSLSWAGKALCRGMTFGEGRKVLLIILDGWGIGQGG
ncbi:MAG: hypothetical protein ACOX0K_02225 [Oscillospiraceae bacterium]